jgi:hypothetical protein
MAEVRREWAIRTGPGRLDLGYAGSWIRTSENAYLNYQTVSLGASVNKAGNPYYSKDHNR